MNADGSEWSVAGAYHGQRILDLNFHPSGTDRIHSQFLLAEHGSGKSSEDASAARKIPAAAVVSRPDGDAVIERDAGTIVLDAFPAAAPDVGARGSVRFEPDAAYKQQLHDCGVDISNGEQLSLALANVSVEALRSLREAYPDAALLTLIAACRMGFLAEMVLLKSTDASVSAQQALKHLFNA